LDFDDRSLLMHITRCPQCETAFKVSPQQLGLAKGWVRCGRCSHVFEAALYFEMPPDMPVSPLMWPMGAGALILALLVQFVLVQRNWLASEEPALRPMFSALCACEVTWPREPEAVLIESSSFTENPLGGYTVQLRLKNTQHHPVAMPALELSLTDLQDQVLVRRVFTAQELSSKDHVPALRAVRLTLNFDLDDKVSKRITGFRAFVFYS
jgi:predicted Zn finger-like uncharacterized protein